MSGRIKRSFDSLLVAAFGAGLSSVSATQRQEMERMFFSGYRCALADTIENPAMLHASDAQFEAAYLEMETEIADYFALLKQVPRDLSKA